VNDSVSSLGVGATPAASNSPLNLGQAIIVSLDQKVLETAQNADKAGRILAEVIAQQDNQVTLKTPDGNVVIKTDAALAQGQVVLLRLDTAQQQAKLLAPIPQFIPPTIEQSAPAAGEYIVRLAPGIEAIQDAADAQPQQNWRGQFLPADLPKEAADIIRFLQAVYRPGSASNQQNLPPLVTEGVTKLAVFTNLLQQMQRIPQTLSPRFFFDSPPALQTATDPSLLQSIQKMSAVVLPAAQKAGEQAGQWLKNNMPSGVMNQLNDVMNKAGAALSPLLQKQEGVSALQPVQMHILPDGLTLLQAWQTILQNPNQSPAPKAPFLLMNMLGWQKPGQDMSPLKNIITQLQQQNNTQSIIPTVVLPGASRETPLMMSPFGLLFHLPANALPGSTPLVPGTIIFWSPVMNGAVAEQENTLPGIPLWPNKMAQGASDTGEWSELSKLWQNHLGQTGLVDETVQNLLPNMAQHARLNGTMTLLLHALNMNSVSVWLGDKTVEKLREGGKQDLLARLVSDFAQMASRPGDAAAGAANDVQRFVLPLIWQEQMAKMVWQIRRDHPDGHEDNPDEQQRKFHTRTRFTVEVPTNRYGDLQMQGTVWKQQLDLNLKTKLPLDDLMRNGIRERFQTALEITGYRGQIIFAD
jgi:hypothetical protein